MKTIKYLLAKGKCWATGSRRRLSRRAAGGINFDKPERAARFACLRFEVDSAAEFVKAGFTVFAVDRHGNAHGMLPLFV